MAKTAKKTKKKAGTNGRAKQQRIEGTYDPPPAALQKVVDEYVDELSQRMEHQEAENDLRRKVIDQMRANNLEKIDLGDEKILVLEHSESDKIKIKRKSESVAAE